MMEPVRVILVNYRAHEKTAQCLRALEQGSLKPECAYVIDNGSTADSQEFFKSLSLTFPVKWIFNPENRGFAAACNQGIREILQDGAHCFTWLLNNDTVPDTLALEKLLNKAQQTQAGITGSQVMTTDGKFSGGVGLINSRFASVHRPATVDCQDFDYVEGSSFLISPECLQAAGPLSEDYFLYFEESDYCLRAKHLGFKLAWATDSVVVHDIGTSTGSEKGKGNVPYFIDCLMIRNRIHFAKTNGFSRPGYLTGLGISLLLRIKRLQWARVFKILQITLSTSAFKKFIEDHGGAYDVHS